MKFYQVLFYQLVCFSLIIHNVTIIPTLDGWIKLLLLMITIAFGVIMVIVSLDYQKLKGGYKNE